MASDLRIPVMALVLSAAGFAGIAINEGYTDKAITPVPGDPYTYGLGSTRREDGSAVRANDKITPPAAIRLAVRDIGGKEAQLRACFDPATLTQYEWDAYVDLSYNTGAGAVCSSSIPGKAKRQDYTAACKTILDFKKVQGRDCSLPANAKFCGGVWARRQAMTRLCLTGERN